MFGPNISDFWTLTYIYVAFDLDKFKIQMASIFDTDKHVDKQILPKIQKQTYKCRCSQ